jgi:hypothetical protein
MDERFCQDEAVQAGVVAISGKDLSCHDEAVLVACKNHDNSA